MTTTEAIVELRSCAGEPVEELRSCDKALLSYLARRRHSQEPRDCDRRPPRPSRRERERAGEETGKASFPASDPPATWARETKTTGGRS